MAFAFDGNGDYLSLGSAIKTAVPFTMGCWVRPANTTAGMTAIFLGDKDNINSYWALWLRGDVAGDPVQAVARNGTTFDQSAVTSTGYSANTWHHACGVFASATSRTAYLDGGGAVGSTVNVTPHVTVDTTAIGMMRDSTPDAPMDGQIAEVAIWGAALTAPEVLSLAKGLSPLLVRPQSLLWYVPLVRNNQDLRQGLTPTAAGDAAVSSVGHPRIYYPSP
jgi:hypothetical protein